MPNFPSCPPPSLLSQHTLHPQPTSRPEALLPNPATSTLFHTVPPADLPLFSPLLNNLSHRSARSGLTRSTTIILLSNNPLLDPKDISVLLLNTTSFHKENKPVLENFAGCARAPRISHLCCHCRGAEQQQIQLFHKDHACINHL